MTKVNLLDLLMPPAAVWLLVGSLMLAGLLGCVLPVLPGTPLIFAAAVLNKVLLPQYLSWWVIGLLGAITLLSIVLELLLPALGSKKLGATNWGIFGASAGALIGLFFGPLGLIAGVFLGAVLAELILAKQALTPAAWAGLGATAGLLVSMAGKILVAGMMITLFLADCFLF